MSQSLRRASAAVNGVLERIFAERRITIRTEARATYYRLSPLTQTIAAALGLIAFAWIGYASYRTAADIAELSLAESRAAAVAAVYDQRLTKETQARIALADRLSLARREVDGALEALSAQTGALTRSAATEAELSRALAELRARASQLETAYVETVESFARTAAHAEELEAALAEERTTTASLLAELGDLTEALNRTARDRDETAGRLVLAEVETGALTETLTALRDRQDRAFARIEDAARVSLAALKSVFDKSGADIDAILSSLGDSHKGAGGPFEPLDEASAAEPRTAALFADLTELNALGVAMRNTPFARPVRAGRLTSGFGLRRDPINRKRALHAGIDYAHRRGTPIYSTADGVVLYSGRQRGYGNIVKIRHAFGYETVYAHLHRRRVKVGDEVKRGDRIGDMGNTGRSTGTHLHYEIRLNGKPVNPAKYIEAARDVL